MNTRSKTVLKYFIILKEGTVNGYNGNYGTITLRRVSTNVFRGNTLQRYRGNSSIGDYINMK